MCCTPRTAPSKSRPSATAGTISCLQYTKSRCSEAAKDGSYECKLTSHCSRRSRSSGTEGSSVPSGALYATPICGWDGVRGTTCGGGWYVGALGKRGWDGMLAERARPRAAWPAQCEAAACPTQFSTGQLDNRQLAQHAQLRPGWCAPTATTTHTAEQMHNNTPNQAEDSSP